MHPKQVGSIVLSPIVIDLPIYEAAMVRVWIRSGYVNGFLFVFIDILSIWAIHRGLCALQAYYHFRSALLNDAEITVKRSRIPVISGYLLAGRTRFPSVFIVVHIVVVLLVFVATMGVAGGSVPVWEPLQFTHARRVDAAVERSVPAARPEQLPVPTVDAIVAHHLATGVQPHQQTLLHDRCAMDQGRRALHARGTESTTYSTGIMRTSRQLRYLPYFAAEGNPVSATGAQYEYFICGLYNLFRLQFLIRGDFQQHERSCRPHIRLAAELDD